MDDTIVLDRADRIIELHEGARLKGIINNDGKILPLIDHLQTPRHPLDRFETSLDPFLGDVLGASDRIGVHGVADIEGSEQLQADFLTIDQKEITLSV